MVVQKSVLSATVFLIIIGIMFQVHNSGTSLTLYIDGINNTTGIKVDMSLQ